MRMLCVCLGRVFYSRRVVVMCVFVRVCMCLRMYSHGCVCVCVCAGVYVHVVNSVHTSRS